MLEMSGMVKSFGANQVLRGISISVAAGEAVENVPLEQDFGPPVDEIAAA